MKAQIQKKVENNNEDLELAIAQLEVYATKAANGVKGGLKNTDLDGYKRFLNMMYHYTLKSGEKLDALAKNSPTQELRDYFEHMYLEERNHYMLAQQDLKGFGLTPSTETPVEVQKFNKFWDSLQGKHINAYLGSIFIFENIAKQVDVDVKDMLQRLNIEKNQRRWLSIHVEVDIGHGEEAKEALGKYLSQNIDAAVEAAKEACERWIEVSATPFAKQ